MKAILSIRHGGRWEMDLPNPDRQGFHHYSSAKFCPNCAQVWATLQLVSAPEYHPQEVLCPQCSSHFYSRSSVPGSIFETGDGARLDWYLIPFLPEAVLRRELDLHLRWRDSQCSTESFNPFSSSSLPGSAIVPADESVTPPASETSANG